MVRRVSVSFTKTMCLGPERGQYTLVVLEDQNFLLLLKHGYCAYSHLPPQQTGTLQSPNEHEPSACANEEAGSIQQLADRDQWGSNSSLHS